MNNIKLLGFTYNYNINTKDTTPNECPDISFMIDTLEILNLSSLNLIELPKLPHKLKLLIATNNQLYNISNIPESLCNINLSYNKLIEFCSTYNTQKIYMTHNNIVELPNIEFMKFYNEDINNENNENVKNKNKYYKLDIDYENNNIKYIPQNYIKYIKNGIIKINVKNTPFYNSQLNETLIDFGLINSYIYYPYHYKYNGNNGNNGNDNGNENVDLRIEEFIKHV